MDLDTLSILSYPLADSPNRSKADFKIFSASLSSMQYFFIWPGVNLELYSEIGFMFSFFVLSDINFLALMIRCRITDEVSIALSDFISL